LLTLDQRCIEAWIAAVGHVGPILFVIYSIAMTGRLMGLDEGEGRNSGHSRQFEMCEPMLAFVAMMLCCLRE
jgi:hypothetical protein